MTLKEKQEIIEELKRKLDRPKRIEVEKCRENIVLPHYATFGDAGMDIRAAIDIDIAPGETKVIPTGLKVVIPFGYELQVRARSGLSLNTPLRIANSIGTIDAGYRDEIGIILTNVSPINSKGEYLISEKGNKFGTYKINAGDRVAQIVLSKFETIDFALVDSISKVGDRGGGFGHSGEK